LRNKRFYSRTLSIFQIFAAGQQRARLIFGDFFWPMKKDVYYIPSLISPHGKEKKGKGLPPSEIKDRDERLSGALDFIHPLGKKQLPGFRGNQAFHYGKFRTISQAARQPAHK
jgi:hypothetical protein